MEAGALNLASPEVKVHMDSSESTGPVDVQVEEEVFISFFFIQRY